MSVGRRRPQETPGQDPKATSQTSFPRPVPFSPFPGVRFLAHAGVCLPESHQGPRASSGYLSLGLAASSPDSDLTSASVLSGVDRVVSLHWELQARDSPHARAEEGQAPLGLSVVVPCQIWSDRRPRGLQAQHEAQNWGGSKRFT